MLSGDDSAARESRRPPRGTMITDVFDYIALPPLSGDTVADLRAVYLANDKAHTAAHAGNVAAAIAGIAARYGLDARACELAAHGHDIAAVIRPEDMLRYAGEQGMDLDPAERKYPFILHQRFSALMAGEVFGIADERVVSAIGHHTTLKAGPSDYDMALFLADKIAWDQAGAPPYLETVERELSRSLYHASLAYIQFVRDHGMILLPHHWLVEAQAWLRDYCSAA
jgi:HD superfamily phosphohydrolase YqeK